MKSNLRLSIALLGLAAALPSQAFEIPIADFVKTPDGSTTAFSQGTDVKALNGNVSVLNSDGEVIYVIATYNFGLGSDVHLDAGFSTSTAPTSANRLGIRIEDTGQVTWLGSGDPSRTSFNFAKDMGADTGGGSGETVTVLMRIDWDASRVGSPPNLGSAWINPAFSSEEGVGLERDAGDMSTIWDSKQFSGFAQVISNQSTPAPPAAGDSSITDTVILTGADASFPRALEYAVDGGPTAAGTVSAYISTVSASPILVADDNATASTITVTLTDSAGDPVAGKVVSLASDGDAGITTGDNISDANGVVTFSVTSGTSGAQEFTATDVTDSNLVLYQTTTVTFETPGTIDPDASTVVASLPMSRRMVPRLPRSL